MSRNTREKILRKLARLDEYLKYLKELERYEKSVFIKDFRIHGLAERYLQLSIEILLDVGRLMIIARDLAKPENNYEIFEILHKAKILSKALFESLRGISGFRNILVHEYEKIDLTIVHANLKSKLKDFDKFKKNIIKKLK